MIKRALLLASLPFNKSTIERVKIYIYRERVIVVIYRKNLTRGNLLKVGTQTRGEENRSQCCVYQLYRFSIVSLLRAAGITRILSTRHALYGFLLGLASSCRPPSYVAAQQRFKVVWEAQTSLPLLWVATVASATARIWRRRTNDCLQQAQLRHLSKHCFYGTLILIVVRALQEVAEFVTLPLQLQHQSMPTLTGASVIRCADVGTLNHSPRSPQRCNQHSMSR